MMLAWVCAGLIAGTPAQPVDAQQQAYQEARAQAGRSPDEQVKLALWCEAHGLTAERLHHLTLAILADPGNAVARGLMGVVQHDGRWRRPEDIADRLKTDPDRAATLAEYEQKRQKTHYTADAQWALGIWASEHGLTEQAKAHLTAVIRLDPSRENAWKKLGYKKHDGRWITDAQLAREKADAEARKIADRKWKPLLEKYKEMLGQPSKRDQAEAALAEVTDPRAVPMIMHIFASGRTEDQLRAVQLLGQVDAPGASRSLAGLAVLAKSAEVRRVAVETLKQRDPRDFIRLWIALVRKPIKFEVRPVGGPGSPGVLFIEGERANLRRVYAPPSMPNVPILPGARLSYDPSGLPVLTEPVGRTRINGGIVWLPNVVYNATSIIEAAHQPAHGGNLEQTLKAQAKAGHPAQAITGYSPYFLSDGELIPLALNGPTGQFRRLIGYEQEQDLRIPVGQMALEAERSAQSSWQQLETDRAELEKVNAAIQRSNEATLLALRTITGQQFGDDPVAWNKWWTEKEGFVLAITEDANKPTIVQEVTPAYVPQTVPQIIGGQVNPASSPTPASPPVRPFGRSRATARSSRSAPATSSSSRTPGPVPWAIKASSPPSTTRPARP